MDLAVSELQRNDFAVADVIIENKAAMEMTKALLMSTIWYDLTKGNTFAAHPDDGLVHLVFKNFTQEVALAMSKSTSKPFKVDRYYALAVDLSSKGTGPMSVGEQGEIIVAVWINPSNPSPPVRIVIFITHLETYSYLLMHIHTFIHCFRSVNGT